MAPNGNIATFEPVTVSANDLLMASGAASSLPASKIRERYSLSGRALNGVTGNPDQNRAAQRSPARGGHAGTPPADPRLPEPGQRSAPAAACTSRRLLDDPASGNVKLELSGVVDAPGVPVPLRVHPLRAGE